MPIATFLQSLLPHVVGSWNYSSEGEWSELPPMSSKRHGSAAATLGRNTLVVMGGHDGSTETDSVDILELKDGVWKTIAGTAMKTQRLGCVAATLQSDEAAPGVRSSECIVVVGGHNGRVLNSVERYHPQLDMWTESTSLPTGGSFDAAAVSITGRLYVIGGHDGKRPSNQMHVFDANFCTWTTCPPMTEKRFQCGATTLENRYIYVVGGDNGEGALHSMEMYDIVSRTWTTLPPMNSKRKGCVAAAVGGCVYVFGGHDGKHVLSSCERYNPATRSWSSLPPMKFKRFGSAIAVLENRIIIVGGFDGATGLSSVEQFTLYSFARDEATMDVTAEGAGPVGDAAAEAGSADERPPTTDSDTHTIEKEPPDELQCPITGDLMVDPVVASDGHSYEREAIEEWFRRFSHNATPRSPTTNGPIERRLFPNHNLKSLCRQYAKTHL